MEVREKDESFTEELKSVINLFDDILKNVSYVSSFINKETPCGEDFYRALTYLVKDVKMFDGYMTIERAAKITLLFNAFDRIIEKGSSRQKINIGNVSMVVLHTINRLLEIGDENVVVIINDYYPDLIRQIEELKEKDGSKSLRKGEKK